MKTSIYYMIIGAFCIAVGSFSGCKEDPPASLYQEKPSSGPSITSIAPSDSALAGVTIVTINGSGFSAVKQENFVNFGPRAGTVLEATTTQLKVRTPIFVGDSTPVKVAVQGFDLFSNAVRYKLLAAVVEFGGIPNTVEDPQGVTTDTAGNVYVSFLSGGGTGLGVKKITPGGARTDYSPPFSSSVNRWTSMKLGPGGFMYTASNRNAVFRIPSGGGSSVPWANTGSVGVSFVTDIDFDQQGNIWGGGDNQSIVRVTPGAPGSPPAGQRAFPFAGEVTAIRYYQNYLYLGTRNDTIWNIWRTRIVSADSIAPRELYFNFTAKFSIAARIYAMTFANDGDLFVGTDSLAGSLVVIHPDKSAEAFYPGLFTGRIQSLAYGKSVEMYVSRTGATDALKKLLRVNTQKQGAPYYGRQ